MLDPISDTPIVLAYAFMSLLVLIVCFIMVNVVHKLYRSLNSDGSAGVSVPLKTAISELDAMKTG
ncbi:hypothetical protein KR200_000950 [Drosophila serrata]|nr:hypothetical protein KR200_000950 [Drosophila serrata]